MQTDHLVIEKSNPDEHLKKCVNKGNANGPFGYGKIQIRWPFEKKIVDMNNADGPFGH